MEYQRQASRAGSKVSKEVSSSGWCRLGLRDAVVRMALSGVVAGCLVLVSPRWARAQDGGSPAAIPASVPHRFFDVQNIALTGIESAALLADGIYTQRALRDYPELFREADPIARPLVSRGWPGQLIGGALFVSAEEIICFTGKTITGLSGCCLVLTVYGTVGAIHGARELRRVERPQASQ
jgi:hypothetical protein